jgi:hypothetical protein
MAKVAGHQEVVVVVVEEVVVVVVQVLGAMEVEEGEGGVHPTHSQPLSTRQQELQGDGGSHSSHSRHNLNGMEVAWVPAHAVGGRCGWHRGEMDCGQLRVPWRVSSRAAEGEGMVRAGMGLQSKSAVLTCQARMCIMNISFCYMAEQDKLSGQKVVGSTAFTCS